MKTRRIVIVEVHRDHDAKEAGDFRHGPLLPMESNPLPGCYGSFCIRQPSSLAARPRCASLYLMSTVLSPIVSEFETIEQEASYDQWFRAKVEEALHSEKPRLPHDAAMAKVQAMLEDRRKVRANRSVV